MSLLRFGSRENFSDDFAVVIPDWSSVGRTSSRAEAQPAAIFARVTCHPVPYGRLGRVSLTFYMLLWTHPGTDEALIAYEDAVLDLVPEHGGRVVQRSRSDGADGRPLEIQLFEFPSAGAFDAYVHDPRRTALATERDRAIAKTELINVRII